MSWRCCAVAPGRRRMPRSMDPTKSMNQDGKLSGSITQNNEFWGTPLRWHCPTEPPQSPVSPRRGAGDA